MVVKSRKLRVALHAPFLKRSRNIKLTKKTSVAQRVAVDVGEKADASGPCGITDSAAKSTDGTRLVAASMPSTSPTCTPDYGGLSESCSRLPRGCGVEAPVSQPWSSDTKHCPPLLISFRKLLTQQHPSISRGNNESATPQVTDRQMPAAARHPGPADAGLAEIGRKDPLSEVIRSMENRLARQGLLAEPATILGHKRKAAGGDAEDFYDVKDTLIDDAELEAVNAVDDPQSSQGFMVKRTGEKANESIHHTAEEVGDAFGEAQMKINLSGFRLAGPDVSGTSEESASGGESDDDQIMLNSESDWRMHLSELGKYLVPVEVMPDGNLAEVPAEVAHQFVDAERGLANLKKALTLCFSECEAAAAAAAQQDKDVLMTAMKACVQTLWEQLPSLLWAPMKEKRQNRIRFAFCLGKKDARDTLSTLDLHVFGWGLREEIAWARFLWRLARTAAQGLRRPSFIKCFADAASESRQIALTTARAALTLEMKETFNKGEVQTRLNGVMQIWAKDVPMQDRLQHLKVLIPFSEALSNLCRCWLRQRFWEQQRQQRRFDTACDQLTAGLLPCFAVHVASHFRNQLGIAIPMDMVLDWLKGDSNKKSKTAKMSTGAKSKSRVVPLQLPAKIFMTVGDERIDCMLENVRGLEKQKVTLDPSYRTKEVRSLEEAATVIIKHHCKSPTIALKMTQALHDRSPWALFSMDVKRGACSLKWLLAQATCGECVPFLNPPDVDPCPLMHIESTPQEQNRKDRKNLLDSLVAGMWVSCKYFAGESLTAKQFYNAQIRQVFWESTSTGTGSKATHVDITWVTGEQENGVDVRRVRSHFMWAKGDIAAVLDRGIWWQCKVLSVMPNEDITKTSFEVAIRDRRLIAPFHMLRQEYTSTIVTPSRGSGSMASGVAKREIKSGTPSGKKVSAPSSTGSKKGHGTNNSGSTSQTQQCAATSAQHSRIKLPRLVPGTKVRFNDKSVWFRGTVKEDFGDRVHIKSRASGGHDAKADDKVMTISIERSKIEVLPSRGSYMTSAAQTGIISVQDSD